MKVFISVSGKKPDPKKYTWFKTTKNVKFELAVADADAEFKKGEEFGIRTLYGRRYILDKSDMSEHFRIDEPEYKLLMKAASPKKEHVEKQFKKAADHKAFKDSAEFDQLKHPHYYEGSAYGNVIKEGNAKVIFIGGAPDEHNRHKKWLAVDYNDRSKVIELEGIPGAYERHDKISLDDLSDIRIKTGDALENKA